MPIIETDDGEIEVPVDAIQLKEDEAPTDLPGVQDEINRVAGKTRQNARSSVKKTLKSDEEAFREIAKAHGYDFREDGRIKGSAAQDEVKELKKRNAKLEQKAQKADELEEQITKARETRLENQLLQYADGVKQDMKDLFLDVAKDNFVYDEDDDTFLPVDTDGNPEYVRSTEDVITELRESRPSMFKDRSASSGPKDKPSATGNVDKKVTQDEYLRASATMSPADFREWERDIEIIED
jgi:hypothetical protein